VDPEPLIGEEKVAGAENKCLHYNSLCVRREK
jgi:hypothetical protein